jgi:predicted lipoprotein with Yx(FWY)xxD motif
MMLHGRRALLALAILAALAIGLAACGGGDSSSSADAGSAGNATVALKSFTGTGEALVDSKGAALYSNDMDSGSKIACTNQCLTEWVPLAAPAQGGPTSSDDAVQAKLGTVKRPDGATQVTFEGMPLYTFAEDQPGQVTGDGFADSFGGTHFVWTAATAAGESGGSSGAASPAPTGGGY